MTFSNGQVAARGAAWSIGGQAVSLAVHFASMSVLARMISPEDFGVVAMVAAVVGIGELVRDFGLTNAVIQAESVSDSESSNLFWLNIAIGLALTTMLLSSAGLIAEFYDSKDVERIVQVLSLTFLINSAATLPRALLIRGLRTRTVAMTDVSSSVAGLILALGLAAAGMGYWAIVGLQLGRYLTTMLLSLICARFLPSLPSLSTSITHFLRFGLGLLGARALVYISMNLDTVLIGRTLGAQQLGFYSRAYQLALMPTSQMASPVSRVALPMLSRLREDQERYRSFLLKAQSIMIITASLGYSVAIVFADIIILLVLGPGWDESIAVFRILCLVGLVDAAHNVTYWIFVSKGITFQHFTYSLVNRPLLMVSLVVAVPFGITTVAWTFAAWICLAWPLGIYWANRYTDIPTRELLLNGVRVIAAFALITLTGMLARGNLYSGSLLAQALSASALMALASVILYLTWPDLRRDVKNTLNAVSLLRRR